MTHGRRQFLQRLGSGVVVAAAAPLIPAAAPAPVLASAPVTAAAAGAGLTGFASVMGAMRDVYSSEIYMRALPVLKLDQFATPSRFRTPAWDQIVDPEVLEVERRIRARVAARMEPGRERRFFDFGVIQRVFRPKPAFGHLPKFNQIQRSG